MGWGGVPPSVRGRPSSRASKLSTVRRELATPSIVPTSARTMLRMERVGGDPEGEDLAFVGPRRGENVALEADVVGLGRGEGGEIVGADEGGGAGAERLAVDLVRPVERPAVLDGLATGPVASR